MYHFARDLWLWAKRRPTRHRQRVRSDRITGHRPWLTRLLARRPTKVAAIALANKLTRMAWAMMARNARYKEPPLSRRKQDYKTGHAGVTQRLQRATLVPSRPGEFHPEPLTDPDLILSHHPARATARRLPPSAEPSGSSWHRQLAQAQRR